MPLKGRVYLVTASGSVLAGLGLVFVVLPALYRRLPVDHLDYLPIILMALAVICCWSSLRCIIVNRDRPDVPYLIVILSPFILAALVVLYHYLCHLVDVYERASRYVAT